MGNRSLPPSPEDQGNGIGVGPDNSITLHRTSNVEREMKTLRNQFAFISWLQQPVAEVVARDHQQRCPAVAVSRGVFQAISSHAFACSPATKPLTTLVNFLSPQLWAMRAFYKLSNNLPVASVFA